MKRILLPLLIIAISYTLIGKFKRNTDTPINLSTQQSNTTPTLPQPQDLYIMAQDGKKISYALVRTLPEHVRLISNVLEASDSATVRETYGCASLINAGFYTKEHTHLGLFKVETTTYQKEIQSTLIDGFVYTIDSSQVFISSSYDNESGSFALQTGPILRYANTIRPLKLITDEYARRVIAATSTTSALYFIVLYDSENVFSGPLLKDVPNIVEKIAAKESVQFTDAINLDGGSASAFITPEKSLSELVPSGGYFCIK